MSAIDTKRIDRLAQLVRMREELLSTREGAWGVDHLQSHAVRYDAYDVGTFLALMPHTPSFVEGDIRRLAESLLSQSVTACREAILADFAKRLDENIDEMAKQCRAELDTLGGVL